MAEEANAVEEMTFRQGMAELENIVALLESNTLELEDSLSKYERGVSLVVSLKKRLSSAQQRVDVLIGELEDDHDDEKQDTTIS